MVITCVRVALFPHSSFAVHVLVNINRLEHWTFVFTSASVITGVPPQLSVAICIGATGISFAQETVSADEGGRPSNTGGCVSVTVITSVRVAELPQTSVAVQVRVRLNLLAHTTSDFTSLNVMVTSPSPQLSVAGWDETAGISEAQETTRGD